MSVPSDDKAVFYRHDNYDTLRRKFTNAWPNLTMELHSLTGKFYHEGYDEYAPDAPFTDRSEPNDIAVTLNDETNSNTAIRLFEENYGGSCFILRNGASVENESLAYCNDPFILPLDRYTYGEFKRRFAERWSNLTIKMFDVSPYHGVLTSGYKELPEEFDMSVQKACGDPLHDYTYISEWGKTLKRSYLGAAISNNSLGCHCTTNERLKDYNAKIP